MAVKKDASGLPYEKTTGRIQKTGKAKDKKKIVLFG
jgi:hypothetical protein